DVPHAPAEAVAEVSDDAVQRVAARAGVASVFDQGDRVVRRAEVVMPRCMHQQDESCGPLAPISSRRLLARSSLVSSSPPLRARVRPRSEILLGPDESMNNRTRLRLAFRN